MRFCKIRNSVVINVIDAPPNLVSSDWVQSDTAQIGSVYRDGVFSDPHPHHEYSRRRQAAYPKLEDQLDALYKHFVSQTVEVPGFTDVITKVKTDFPKAPDQTNS